jgi:hypothetical protein
MPTKLSTTVNKIRILQNEGNVKLILKFHEFKEQISICLQKFIPSLFNRMLKYRYLKYNSVHWLEYFDTDSSLFCILDIL